MIFQIFAVMSSMTAGNIDVLPPVYWSEETYVGEDGTVHVEARESDIESGEGDCIVVVTMEDGAPDEFYTQQVAPGHFRKMGKIRFIQNGGAVLWLTEDQISEVARLLCYN